jgi:hypothetical protein
MVADPATEEPAGRLELKSVVYVPACSEPDMASSAANKADLRDTLVFVA